MTTTYIDMGDAVEVETKDTTTVIKFGPLARFAMLLRAHPIRSLIATGAIAGAGYMAYDYARDGKVKEAADSLREGAEVAADFFG